MKGLTYSEAYLAIKEKCSPALKAFFEAKEYKMSKMSHFRHCEVVEIYLCVEVFGHSIEETIWSIMKRFSNAYEVGEEILDVETEYFLHLCNLNPSVKEEIGEMPKDFSLI